MACIVLMVAAIWRYTDLHNAASAQLGCGRSPGFREEPVDWQTDAGGTTVEDVGVDHSRRQVLAAQQFLHGVDVAAVFEQMGREGIAEGWLSVMEHHAIGRGSAQLRRGPTRRVGVRTAWLARSHRAKEAPPPALRGRRTAASPVLGSMWMLPHSGLLQGGSKMR